MELSENDYRSAFMSDLKLFESTYNVHNIRIYGIELPVLSEDGNKRADLVLESAEEGHIVTLNQGNPTFILEFKRDNVDYHSAVAQVIRYRQCLSWQLHRKQMECLVIAPSYSEAEQQLAIEQNVALASYDPIAHRLMKVTGDIKYRERAVARRR